MSRKSLKTKIAKKIERSKKTVFARINFVKLSDYDQIGRALLELVREKKLIRIGYGLYAKARINRITNKPMLAAKGGFEQVCKESLQRLKIKWEPGIEMQQYSTGSTQIPMKTRVIIHKRMSRKISYNEQSLQIEIAR